MVKSYLRYNFQGATGSICSPECNILLDKDGKNVLAGTNETVTMWNTRTGGIDLKMGVMTTFPDPPFTHQATFIAQNPVNAEIIAVGYSNGSVRLWNSRQPASKPIPHGLGYTVMNARDIVNFRGHKSAITALCFSPDGSQLVSGSQDTDMVMWDIESEQALYRFRGHAGPITGMTFISEGILVSSSRDGMLRVWHCATQAGIQVLADHPSEVWSLALAPGGNVLFAAGAHSWIRVYEVDRAALTRALQSDGKATADVKILIPKGGVARPWGSKERVHSMQVLAVNEEGQAVDEGVAVEVQRQMGVELGGFLVCQTSGKSVELFRLQSTEDRKKKLKRRLRRAREKSKAQKAKRSKLSDDVSSSSDDEEADLELDGEVDEANLMPGETAVVKVDEVGAADILTALHQMRLPAKARAMSLQAVPAPRVAVSLENNSIEVRKIELDTLLKVEGSFEEVDRLLAGDKAAPVASRVAMSGHAAPPRSVQTSSDDMTTMSVSSDAVRVWNNRTLACIKVVPVPGATCGVLMPSNDMALVGTSSGDLLVVDLAVGEVVSAVQDAHTGGVISVTLHPSKGGCATVGKNKKIGVWRFGTTEVAPSSDTEDSDAETETKTVPSLELIAEDDLADEPTCVTFTPRSAKHVAVGLLNNTIEVRYADSMKPFLTLYGHQLPVTSLDISTDGSLLVSGSADKTLKIWGLDFGDCHTSLRGHKEPVTAVKFFPLTHYVLSGSRDATVRMWDVDERQHITTFEGHRSPIGALAIGSDGAYFVSAGQADKSLRVWARGTEQLFLSEERAMEMDRQLEEEATRDDLDAVGAKEVASARPTRRTVEAVRSTERLMQVIDDAVTAHAEELEYRHEYAQWKAKCESIEKQNLKGMVDTSILTNPPPPPQLNWQFQGRTAHQHVLHMLRSIPASHMAEVVLALPFSSACVLLKFIVVALEAFEAANRQRESRLSDAREKLQELRLADNYRNDTTAGKRSRAAMDKDTISAHEKALQLAVNRLTANLVCERTNIEMPCRVALSLVQIHMKQLRTSEIQRPLLMSLRRVLQPLISRELQSHEQARAALETIIRSSKRDADNFKL